MSPDVYTFVFLFVLIDGSSSGEFATTGCSVPLGMQSGRISDQQLSASSHYSSSALVKFARLNTTSGTGWCPNQRPVRYPVRDGGPYYDQYLQVSFSQPLRITAIETQGRGMAFYEILKEFRVNYTIVKTQWKEAINYHTGNMDFQGAKNTTRNVFIPELLADTIRVIPAIYPTNQVCFRLELYGCELNDHGLASYSMFQGNVLEGKYNLSDFSYSGVTQGSTLSGGQGVLTDNRLASKNYEDNSGRGWIGWQQKKTPNPYVMFTFVQPRQFQNVTFHCNVRTSAKVELFSAVSVKFSFNDTFTAALVNDESPIIDSAHGWLSYNVTVDLCGYQAKVVRFDFQYRAEWILLSEVIFVTDPVGPQSRPRCSPSTTPVIPATSAVNGSDTTAASSPHGGLNVGSIIGIVFAAVVLLLCVLLVVYWRRSDCRLLHVDKPFSSFIHVELKPENRHQSTLRRISQLSTDSDEGKAGSFKSDVTACPIYASIQDHLDRNGKGPPETTRNGSEKTPPPPLGKPPPSAKVPEVLYAEPDSPLLTPSTDVDPGSPLHPDQNDARYAEPSEPLTNRSPRMSYDGYAEPIDVITKADVFRNPVYEEVYANPYQGVSGTSLYADPNEAMDPRRRLYSIVEFPRDKLHFREKIGDGQFGEVHIGEAEGLDMLLGKEFKNCKRTVVAIKKLKPEVDKNIKDNFFKEVKIMASLRHENVVRLLGVCKDDPMCMIVEYMANGDLNQFLKERHVVPGSSTKERELSLQALLYMALQLAAGMKYIASLNFVHRDLATRNLLVGHSFTVKIADFGMSRNLYCKHYYRVQGRAVLPIRWMAPECILQGRFTTASDVWAFGVTLWEILTLSRQFPYTLTDEQMIESIQKLFFSVDSANFPYLEQPAICPDDLYQLMKSCWEKEPADRPTFNELHTFLKTNVRHSEMSV